MHRRATTEPYILHAGEHLAGEDPGVRDAATTTGGVISVNDSETTEGAPLHDETED